ACICGLDFTFAVPHAAGAAHGLGRSRQVSTLSLVRRSVPALKPKLSEQRSCDRPRLSSVLQTPRGATVPPTLTPFTSAVSEPSAQFVIKSLASTNFATQARIVRAILQRRAAGGGTARAAWLRRRAPPLRQRAAAGATARPPDRPRSPAT